MAKPEDALHGQDGHKIPNEQTHTAMAEARSRVARRLSQRVEAPKESRMAIETLPTLTKPARLRWDTIPADIRQRLLSNVWCGHCGHGVSIINFSGTMKAGNVLLVGQCAKCHGGVARLIDDA